MYKSFQMNVYIEYIYIERNRTRKRNEKWKGLQKRLNSMQRQHQRQRQFSRRIMDVIIWIKTENAFIPNAAATTDGGALFLFRTCFTVFFFFVALAHRFLIFGSNNNRCVCASLHSSRKKETKSKKKINKNKYKNAVPFVLRY